MKTTDQILSEAADTFRTRNANYKSNYLMVGQLMAALFPDGITLKTAHDHNRFHLFMLMMVKVSRYAIQWNNPHQDSIRDACVYAAMVECVDAVIASAIQDKPLRPKFSIGDEVETICLVASGTMGNMRRIPIGTIGFVKKGPKGDDVYVINNANGSFEIQGAFLKKVEK